MKSLEKHTLYIGKDHDNPIILDCGQFKLEIKIEKAEDIEYILAKLDIEINCQYSYLEKIG